MADKKLSVTAAQIEAAAGGFDALKGRVDAHDTTISEKLPKSPTDWEQWTADEQKAARERMGIPGDYELLRDISVEEDISMINLGDVQSKDAIIIIKSVSGCGNTPFYKTSSGMIFYAGNGVVTYSVARISRYYVETTARSTLNDYTSCSKLLADLGDANVGNLSLHGNITENSITAGTNIKIYVR